MKYSEELIEEVRQRSDIVSVIGQYVTLKKKGNNYFGLCPFHNEKTGSFSVSVTKQMYYCFGCHAAGSVFTFLREYENLTFQEALKELAQRAGIDLPDAPMTAEERQQADASQQMYAMYRDAANFYYKVLYSPAGQAGMNYLLNRGLSPETIKKYGLGYAPSGNAPLYNYLKKKGYSDRQMKEGGLVRFDENRGARDYFWNRVMFPIMDKNSHVIAFGGRVMGDGEPKYLNSQESLIFKKSKNLYGQQVACKNHSDVLLICEGYMDVISLHQAGFTNAVAALGTAFNIDHVVSIKRMFRGKDKVVLTFDSDGAGRNAALKAIPVLKDGGMEDIRVLTMKPCKDPDEFIKAYGAEAYQKRIDEAKNAFLFEVEILREGVDLTNPDQKTKYQHAIAGKLVQMEDEIRRTNYMEAVCRQESIDFGEMKRLVNKLGMEMVNRKAYEDNQEMYRKKVDPQDGMLRTEQLLLTWLCEYPSLVQVIEPVVGPEDFQEELTRQLAAQVYEQARQGKVEPAKILDSYSETDVDQARVAGYFHYKLPEGLSPDEMDKALTETVQNVKRDSLRRRSAGSKDVAELQKFMVALSTVNQISLKVPRMGQ